MKVGLRKPMLDLSRKHIQFELDGKTHNIFFRITLRKGITEVTFDSKPVKVTSTYPPLPDVIRECVLVTWFDFKHLCATAYRMFVRKKI